MPLPHPPGYQPPRQSQVDRRRVLLAAVVLAVLAETQFELYVRFLRSVLKP